MLITCFSSFSGSDTASEDWGDSLSGRPLDLDSEISSIAPLSSMIGSVHTLLSIPVYRNLLAGECVGSVGWGHGWLEVGG
jgi:hypothetical protein